jgi:hypothetical protein
MPSSWVSFETKERCNIQIQSIMSHKHLFQLSLGLGTAVVLSSCAAGVVDRTEDRYDRREDRYDRRHYSGPGDRVEDYYDKRENVNDKLRGRRGL